MNITLYEDPAAYLAEYRMVRGRLTERGTTFNKWCIENGFQRQTARLAMLGKSIGPKSAAIRRKLLTDTAKP